MAERHPKICRRMSQLLSAKKFVWKNLTAHNAKKEIAAVFCSPVDLQFTDGLVTFYIFLTFCRKTQYRFSCTVNAVFNSSQFNPMRPFFSSNIKFRPVVFLSQFFHSHKWFNCFGDRVSLKKLRVLIVWHILLI